MEFSNTSKQSLGNISLQSGNNVPNNVDENMAMFFDTSDATMYVNMEGYPYWMPYKNQNVGYVFLTNNSLETSLNSSFPTWYSLTGLSWNFSSDTMSLSAGTDGKIKILSGQNANYNFYISATIQYVSTANNIEIGLSVNNQVPYAPNYNGTYIDEDRNNNNIIVVGNINLNVGDSLSLVVSRITPNTGAAIIRHATLLLDC